MTKKKKKAPSRDIPLPVRCALWGMAAGRCERCNRLVYRDPTTKELVNISEAAHIIGFSKDGPRGEKELSAELAKDVGNLMLLCRICHRTIDTNKAAYPISLLQPLKREHESRVEIQTGVDKSRSSHILLYGANIGDLARRLSYDDAAPALLPLWYPADTTPIALLGSSSTFRDRNDVFWRTECEHLENWVAQHVLPRLASGDIRHLSIFALAPQPLLIQLGALLTDIPPAEVYQLHREPPDWCWAGQSDALEFIVEEPQRTDAMPALVLSLSAEVTDERITAVVGQDAAIWRMTVEAPHNDIVKSRDHLRAFRETVRPLMDRIKAKHGQGTPLHVFPVVPASIAVEFGRIQMPKAHMPLCIYDQNRDRGGFVKALEIGNGEGT